MKFIILATYVAFVHSFAPLSSITNVKGQKIVSNSHSKWHKSDCKQISLSPLRVQSNEDIFDAEEAAMYDASDISDSGVEAAVMERAVMMANDMMRKKKQELIEKVEDARAAEQQYFMMEQAAKDLVDQYNTDPTKFKEEHVTKDGAQVAIEMLESVIADAAQKMVDLENTEMFAISEYYKELEEEQNIAEARAAKEAQKEEAANQNVLFIEEFDDVYEIEERRRDMAAAHAAHESLQNQEELAKKAFVDKEELMEKEDKLERQLADYKQHEEVLKADLREIQETVRERLLEEWEQQQQQQQQNQQQQGMM